MSKLIYCGIPNIIIIDTDIKTNSIDSISILKITDTSKSFNYYKEMIINSLEKELKELKNSKNLNDEIISKINWDKYENYDIGDYVVIYDKNNEIQDSYLLDENSSVEIIEEVNEKIENNEIEINIENDNENYNLNNDNENYNLNHLNNLNNENYNLNNLNNEKGLKDNLNNENSIVNNQIINKLNDLIDKNKNYYQDQLLDKLNNLIDQNKNQYQESNKLKEELILSKLQQVLDNQNKTLKSQELGVKGEEEIFEIIKSSFPDYENLLVSKTSHISDIHSIDRKNKLLYVYEIKNKSYITSDDLTKFNKDLQTVREKFVDLKVIGIFISIHSPIPRIGNLSIKLDKCYLTKEYVNAECIKLIVNMYSNILSKTDKSDIPKNKYIIPNEVYRLISELKSQYSILNANKEIYENQIKMNDKSTGFMHELLAKTKIQLSFIEFLNQEFESDINLTNEVEKNNSKINKLEEERLEKYIKSTNKKLIRKNKLLELFPNIDWIKTSTLNQIIDKYTKDSNIN